MWVVTAQKKDNYTKRFFKTLREASAVADALIQEKYENISVDIYRGQLPLFHGEYDEEG